VWSWEKAIEFGSEQKRLTKIEQISFTAWERNAHSFSCPVGTETVRRRIVMPLLLPVLIGIPVVVGGGWIIYKIVG
jgi:hypothetical protein